MKASWFGIFCCFFWVVSCQNASGDLGNNAKSQYDSIAKFDSLNWSKEFPFKKANRNSQLAKQQFLQQFYKSLWLDKNVSGGLLVAQHGEIIFEGYNGYSDIENQEILDSNTPIHIASISKVLTALAILKLAENNKINLNDAVAQYLIGFPYEEVKIEDLMNHRSGLPNYLSLSDDKNYWDNTQMMDNQALLTLLIDKQPPALGAPAKNFFYNNTNYVILALVIEKITGLTYPQAMKQMVFDPLGMKNTFVMEFDKDADRVSKSYYNNGREWGYDHLDATYGDKNIYSTPRDLLMMDIAMYSDKFLPKKIKEMAWKGYSYERKGVKNYGLGFRMMEWEDDSKILYHNGKWHGNNTVYVRDFENEATIIALGNRLNSSVYASMKLVSLFGDYPYQLSEKNTQDAALVNLQNKLDKIKQNLAQKEVKKPVLLEKNS